MKGYFNDWMEKDKLMLIRGWKLKGLNDEQIAQNIGIHPRTFEKWKAKSEQLRQVLKRSKESAVFTVESALYKKALSGNVTAMIFFLKNNYNDKYSEKSDVEKEYLKAKTEKLKAEIAYMESDRDFSKTLIVDDFSDEDLDE